MLLFYKHLYYFLANTFRSTWNLEFPVNVID